MHSSLYGVPSEARRLREADANADFNWWMLMGLAANRHHRGRPADPAI